jgi:hypothetical protein
MALAYRQFKTAQEMEAYLNAKYSTPFFTAWYTNREVAEFIDNIKLRVYENISCPELDY